MRKIVFSTGLVFLFLLVPLVVLAATVGSITFLTGRADIIGPDEVARPAAAGDQVVVEDSIRTKTGARVEITFTDGTIVRVAQQSRVRISEYQSGEDASRAAFFLSRGRIQSIVSTTGKVFGRLKQNSFEVRTPNVVVGVRGTNFFASFLEGISRSFFKLGQGYVFSLNKPDVIMKIQAGQAMLAADPNQPPVIRQATEAEIRKEEQETAPIAGGVGDAGDPGERNGSGSDEEESGNKEETGGSIGGDSVSRSSMYAGQLGRESFFASRSIGYDERTEIGNFYVVDNRPPSSATEIGPYIPEPVPTTDSGDPLMFSTSDCYALIKTNMATMRQMNLYNYLEGGFYESWYNNDNSSGGYRDNRADGTYTMFTYSPSGVAIHTWDDDPSDDLYYHSYAAWDPASFNLATIGIPPAGAPAYDPETVEDYSSPTLNILGELNAIFGGTESLWGGNAAALNLKGTLRHFGAGNGIWSDEYFFHSSNQVTGLDTTYEDVPGAYIGRINGIRLDSQYSGGLVGLYIDPSLEAGFLNSRNFSGSVSADLVLTMSGSVSREPVKSVLIAPENIVGSIQNGWLDIAGIGRLGANGVVSFLGGSAATYSLVDQANAIPEPWGILAGGELMGGFTNPGTPSATGWSAAIGGGSELGAYFLNTGSPNDGTLIDDTGFWYGGTSSSWQNGRLSTVLEGSYVSGIRLGDGDLAAGTGIKADILGTYNGTNSGNWSANLLGTWQGAPLAFGLGQHDPDQGWVPEGWGGVVYFTDINGEIHWAGHNWGNLGGIESPWDGPADFLAIGRSYALDPATSYAWAGGFYGYALDSAGVWQGGYFSGYNGGAWQNEGMHGWAIAMAVAGDGSAGYFTGAVTDGAYSSTEDFWIWKSRGMLAPVPAVIATGLDPMVLDEVEDGFYAAGGNGAFKNAGNGSIATSEGPLIRYSRLNGQDWGVWRTDVLGGSYTNTTADDWQLQFGGDSVAIGSKWSAGELSGRVAGGWVSISEAESGELTGAGTKVLGGKIAGTFDPVALTWQAAAGGPFIETGKFLALLQNNPAAVAQLGIPSVEVGRATLVGGDAVLTDVRLNDLIFLAYSTGAPPMIFAGGNAAGSFDSVPAYEHTVTLNGNNLSVDFTVDEWRDNYWSALLAGGGTYTGTGSLNGTAVQVNGNAAGVYDLGAKSFSGTASGTVASP